MRVCQKTFRVSVDKQLWHARKEAFRGEPWLIHRASEHYTLNRFFPRLHLQSGTFSALALEISTFLPSWGCLFERNVDSNASAYSTGILGETRNKYVEDPINQSFVSANT